ncbi:MAG: hypothetical protein CMJ25_06840 [Phycisphaerae bacterium]|nr:hypothetical protein [Phycisphaerae bacterium]|tara:strand:- start:289 stop:2283 length:1995 start_codon:yes stop_codon:yes gene_type:complete
MAYQPIEPVGLGRNVSAEMMKGGPKLQQEIKQMGPNTIKMIALQQIADQQKQKASQANLQAQTNPATVVQQLEQQLGGMGQPQQSMGLPPMRDKAQQVGGALAQKQQQQQKNMQRAAQGQGRPMMAGGGLLSRPAPNIDPRYFEGGGIVAFAEGGGVSSEELKDMGLTYEQFAKLSSKQQEAVAKQINFERRQKQDLSRLDRVASGTLDIATAPIVAGANVLERARTSGIGKSLGLADPEEEARRAPYMQFVDRAKATDAANAGRTSQEGILSQIKRDMGGESVRTGIDTLTKGLQGQFDENIGGPSKDPLTPYSGPKIPKPAGQSAPEEVEVEETERVYAQLPAFEGAELPDSAKSTAPDKSKLSKGIASLRGADPATQRDEASRYYKENMALDPEVKKEMDLMARRTREREEGYKPSRLRTIRETLAGADSSLGGMSDALSKRQDSIETRRDSLFKARQDSVDKLVARSDGIASGALTYGQTEKESAKQDIRSALTAELGIFQSESADFRAAQQREAQVVLANASNEVRTDIANLTAKVQQQTTDALNSFRENSLTAEDTKSQRSLMGTLVTAKQRAEASIATAVAKLTSDVAFAAPPENYEGTPEEYRKEVVSSAITGLAASLAPLDAMIAEFGGNLGIDIPERPTADDVDASGFKLKGVK